MAEARDLLADLQALWSRVTDVERGRPTGEWAALVDCHVALALHAVGTFLAVLSEHPSRPPAPPEAPPADEL